MLNVRIIDTVPKLEALRADWDRLVDCTPGNNAYCRYEWARAWWDFYGRGNQLSVLAAEAHGENIVAIAPLYRTYSAKTGKCIRLLGSNVACSDYLRIPTERTLVDTACEAFADKLLEMNKSRETSWEILELAGTADGDESIESLKNAMRKTHCQTHVADMESTWLVKLPETWEACVLGLGRSFRRVPRKLKRDYVDTGRVELVKALDSTSFERGWEILVDLHQKRRASLGQPGCFVDPRFTGFLRQAAIAALEDGSLRLQWTLLEGRPLGVSISFACGDTIGMYQAGIEPDLMEHRPGHMHNMLAIRSAIGEGKRVYDFLRGDESYKQLWGAEPTSLQSTRIVSPRVISRIRHHAWLGGTAIKKWIKPSDSAQAE